MGTHYQGDRSVALALDAYIKLMRAANSVTHRVNRALTDDKLTISQFGILESLLHLGNLQQHMLGEKLLKSGGNITMVVDNLEKRKLIVRERCSADRRCIWIKLTAEGRKLIKRVFPNVAKLLAETMNTLPESKVKAFGEMCKRVGLSAANN